MNYVNENIITLNRISITNMLQDIGPEEVISDIVTGLQAPEKSISSKYFYDRKGSLLFEEITRLKEYYPTRTEKSILKRIAPGLMGQYKGYELIELGPGDHSKISILLNAASGADKKSIHYLPLDISQPAIKSLAESLVSSFPNLHVEGYALDFLSQFEPIQRKHPAMICFFGSTIGNFEWSDSLELLGNISLHMKKGDVLLLGMDLVKPEAVLHVAYNDARGITATFNRNILNSVNDLIKSDFQTSDFDHLAFFNKEKSRMEMHLIAKKEVTVCSPHFIEDLKLNQGDSIHTENSHKYSATHIQEIAEVSGLKLNKTHTDERGWFALSEFQKG